MSLTNGEQKIFIWIDFSPETEVTLLHGLQIALILNKEICLIYHTTKESTRVSEAESRLLGLTVPIAGIIGPEHVHTFITTLPLSSTLTELAEKYDALLLIAHKNKSKELLSKLPYSGFPFLFVSAKQNPEKSYQKIAVPVGYMKKSKDLALWSSYFARHNGAKVMLIKAMETSDEDKKRVMSNLFSVERLFKNFAFPAEIVECHSPTWKIQKKALEQALGFQQGLLIISFTYSSSLIDRFFGVNDTYVIDHSAELSVMCINSQRDLYTLCG